MQSITNAFLNTIFVGLPEQMFIVIITLSLLKINDLLDILMWKRSLTWIMLTALPVAIMANIFKYIIIVPKQNSILSIMFLMIILMEYIVITNSFDINISLIFKTAIYTVGSFVIVGIIEYAYCPLLLSLLDKPYSFFNDNVMYNILWAIPIKILHLCIVSLILVRKNSKVKINLFSSVIRNKFIISGLLLVLSTRVLVVNYMNKLVENNSIIIKLQFIDELIAIVIITSIPLIFLTWLLMVINHYLCKEKTAQMVCENVGNQDYENMIN